MGRNTRVDIWEIRKGFFFLLLIKACSLPHIHNAFQKLHLILHVGSFSICTYSLGNVSRLRLVANTFIFCTGTLKQVCVDAIPSKKVKHSKAKGQYFYTLKQLFAICKP